MQDTIAPTITCPTNIAVNNGLGVCGATVIYSQPTITDNCGGSGSNTLANVLSNFTANSNTILATIPTPYLFAMDGGSNSISDGGGDMYDGGNYLNTNLANNILYSQNTITNSAAFGAGGSYFTSYTTSGGTAMFILAADINSISNFRITGDIGADGGGSFDSSTFTLTVNGITYNCFVKRIYNAGDPSVNQIMMIPANASASQSIGTNTDDGFHSVDNINASTRIYYLLYAGSGGAYINNTQTQAIAQAFLSNTTTLVALAATQTAGLPSGSVFPIGTTTNTFSTTDGSGNTSTCSFNVVVTDSQAPTVVTQNITAQLDAAGNATITAAQINNGSTDNCAIDTITVSPSTFTCANVGANTVTPTVTDVNGNVAAGTAVVTVQDSVLPTVLTQNLTVQLDAAGNATINAAQINNGSTDICGINSVTVSPSTFTCANVGANTVTLTVTDVNGNVATGTAIVTVQDVTAPSITCAADVITNTTSGCIALVPNVPPAVIDACATTVTVNGLTQNSSNVLQQTVDCSVNAFSQKSYRVYDLFALGINSDIQINNIRAVAVNGATIQANIYSYTGSFSGTTLDMTAATLIATSNSVTGSGALQTLIFPAHIIAGASKFLIEITNLSTTVRYGIGYNTSGTDARESYVSRQGCVDVPTKLSVFNLQANKLICVVDAKTASAENLVTFSGVPLNFEYPVGTTTTTYTVTDASGNSSSCNRLITVQDNTPPTVITQNLTVQLNAAGTATITAAQINNGSTDNCGIATITVSPSTFTCANVGANTVTLTIIDVNGNVATGTAIVTVQDTIFPTVVAQNLTVQLNAAGNATITGAQINNGSSDKCGIAIVTVLPNTFNCTNLGNNTVTLTVTDVNGNISTATATVTVRDQTIPVVITQNVTVPLGPNGQVTVSPTLVNNGSFDNCGFTLTLTPNTFGAANVGPNTVILVATDSSGNVSFATAIVTIIDNTPPTVLTQNSTVQLDATGNATITAAQINNGSTDNTSIASISVAASAFTCANLGANTVTLTVTDLYGNVGTNTAIVTVVDSILPTITAPANVIVNTNTGCTATGVVLGTPITADNCSVASVTNNAPTVFPLGVTTVTWTVTDGSGNIRTATQAVRVNDIINPTITAPANVVVSANNSCTAVNVNLGTPVSADNCSVASVTNNGLTTYPLGVTTVTWTVTDGSGNTATVTQTVTVNDTTLPTIVAPAALTVSSSATCGVTGLALGTPVTGDNCSVATVTNDARTTFPLGNTTVTWTVTDGAGNIRTATQVVTVVDTTLPTITAPANIVTTTNTGCTATGVVLGTTVTADNCSVASVTNDAPATFPLGTTTVTWTVTDGSGNIRTAIQTVRVNDNVNPTITAPANVTVASNNNCVAVNVNLGTPVRADNCSVVSVTNNGLTTYPLGVTTVTWTVTDGSGNTATSTQTVTVVDAVLPTIVAPASINVNTNSTSCTATNIPLGFPVAADNCSVTSVTNNAPVAFPLGNTTVIWTVTDASGNTATATQVVTVRDASAPVVITQNISAFLNAAGTVTITAAQVKNGSSDNCGIASVVVTPTTFNCSKLGANVVTLIVTDVNGNVASGTAIVTVVDNLAPTAVTQNITAILNPNGQVTITAAMVNNGSFDNCSVASVALSKTVFDCSNLGTNTVLFTVTDGSGNTRVVPVQVTVTKRFGDVDNVCGELNINVSQAITPNGDGVNDTWMISNIESYPKNNVKVFNRWGSEVFSANVYRNDWNGHYKNSDQSLPDASSYYYQIDLDGDGTIEKDGWIYISRL